ncbi:MAG: ABC transporter ATP-binding protein [Nanoarchaeota archaeon]|nr:ABC transporter ATP-binding protein [Nanoarchaeota archaeon]MBU1030445.1 ABC transporter ATP-binding protein [Nanoarchaeota archaeon]MBU1849772.1 ABC transporter ATP-binding protein [Nanoarchaeota archaeon]
MKYSINIKNVTKGFVDKNEIMPSWMISSRNKNIFYAVKNVSLHIKKQEIFGVLGPNGCGKSTIIRMISTLLIPDTGQIKVLGIDALKTPDKIKNLINRVSVEASFFKRLSARENLLYAARLYGIEDKIAIKKFTQILSELNFPKEKINEPMQKFSRGLQQKVSIARGFITNPKIILLDEPTTGLDPKSKIDVQKFLKKLHAKNDLTIVITSHDMNEIEKLCDRIAIMDNGKIIAMGTKDELTKIIMDKEVYELDSSNNQKAKKIVSNIVDASEIIVENKKIRFHTQNITNVAEKIIKELKKNKVQFKNLNKVVPSLEDVFLELTGKTLEDEE